MSRECFGKNKIAALLTGLLLLDFCPAFSEEYLSSASALTIVHERSQQRGRGEFRRLPSSGSGSRIEEVRGDDAVRGALPKENVPEADGLFEQEKTVHQIQEEPGDEKDQPEPEKAEELKPVEINREEEKTGKNPEKEEAENFPAVMPVKAVEKAENPLETSEGIIKRPPAKIIGAVPEIDDEDLNGLREPKTAAENRRNDTSPQNIRLRESKTAAVDRPRKMTLWPMKTQDVGGTLLLSDNPEYITRTGIYYSEQIKGDARVLYYHVNETRQDLRIAVVLENRGEAHAVVHINRLGLAEPSSDYLAVGKAVQRSYFGSQSARSFILAPGERRILCREQERQLIRPKDLASSYVDFTVSRPVMATVLVHKAEDSPLKYIEDAPIIKAVGRKDTLRGSYTGMNRLLTGKKRYHPRRDGIVYFTIGDGDMDKFHSGIDSADGTIMTNEGNYGIVYNVTIPCGRGGFRVYLAPRGGIYAGAVNVETDESIGSTRLIDTPGESGWDFGTAELLAESYGDKTGKCLLSPKDEVTLLGFFRPWHELRLEMSPPPASNLPVRIILVPEGMEPLASEAKKG